MADEEWDEEREELEHQREWERERELNGLHWAARDGDLEEVQRLVAQGRDLNLFDDLDRTPLHYAAERGHWEVMAYLIKAGADVNAHHESRIGETPLGQVAGECSLEVAKMLIDAGADPTIPGWMQLTALYRAEERASKTGKFKSVYKLLLAASRKKMDESKKRM